MKILNNLYIRTCKEKKQWQDQFVVRDAKRLKVLKQIFPDKPFGVSYQEVEKRIFDQGIPLDWKTFKLEQKK